MKASLNNTHIAYSDHGIGLPVIFLHAFPLNRTMWDGEIAALLDEQGVRIFRGEMPNNFVGRHSLGLGGVERSFLSENLRR